MRQKCFPPWQFSHLTTVQDFKTVFSYKVNCQSHFGRKAKKYLFHETSPRSRPLYFSSTCGRTAATAASTLISLAEAIIYKTSSRFIFWVFLLWLFLMAACFLPITPESPSLLLADSVRTLEWPRNTDQRRKTTSEWSVSGWMCAIWILYSTTTLGDGTSDLRESQECVFRTVCVWVTHADVFCLSVLYACRLCKLMSVWASSIMSYLIKAPSFMSANMMQAKSIQSNCFNFFAFWEGSNTLSLKSNPGVRMYLSFFLFPYVHMYCLLYPVPAKVTWPDRVASE